MKPVRRINMMTERVKRGLTVKKIGELFNVTPATIRSWEIGEYTPDGPHVQALCEFYNVTPTYLLAMNSDDHEKGK